MADVLVLSAHPDDAELGAGGTIAKLTNEGKHVVLVDCTAGELGTRGTPELRTAEANAAAKALGVTERVILSMPDGTCVGAALFSVIGASVPAAKAADVDPVRALRHE